MKQNIIKVYLIFSTIAVIILYSLLMIKPNKVVVIEKNPRAYNDSILVLEYQEALDRYMDRYPKEADKFIDIIEEINTK